MASLTFGLRPVPPFRLDLTAWALRRRARNIVDRWEDETYSRVVMIEEMLVRVMVTQTGPREHPKLAVTISGHLTPHMRATVTRLLTDMLGLRTNLQSFYKLAASDRRLAPLVERFRGLKPPRFPSPFEALVNAVACQQLSLTVGIELLNRLAGQCGPVFGSGDIAHYAFPQAQDLLHLRAHTFRQLGFSYNKARALLEASRAIVSGQFSPEQMRALDNQSAVEYLMKLGGVGRWTAEYILLRGLGRIDTFPGDECWRSQPSGVVAWPRRAAGLSGGETCCSPLATPCRTRVLSSVTGRPYRIGRNTAKCGEPVKPFRIDLVISMRIDSTGEPTS
jgi:DNA-3-methyladenine glycosylase II